MRLQVQFTIGKRSLASSAERGLLQVGRPERDLLPSHLDSVPALLLIETAGLAYLIVQIRSRDETCDKDFLSDQGHVDRYIEVPTDSKREAPTDRMLQHSTNTAGLPKAGGDPPSRY